MTLKMFVKDKKIPHQLYREAFFDMLTLDDL